MQFPSPCSITNVANPELALSMLVDGREEGTPLVCRPRGSPETTFEVVAAQGGYTIQGRVSKWFVSANPDNLQKYNYAFVADKPFTWYIEPAGNSVFKILIPNKDDCMQLPENPEDGNQVAIERAHGNVSELWRIEPGHEF